MIRLVPLCLLAIAPAIGAPEKAAEKAPEIPYSKFILKNGLTVIAHEDRKSPVVGVTVWYHVGSKNEQSGRTGFAHLFEHLMFNGSEHHNDDWFRAMDKVGATAMNGTTSEDRTNYFQTVPKDALDFVLWLESDRMGHLLGVIDQARLDEQRGVVQNEKRQGENEPYGLSWEMIQHGTYPPGHPYSWTVIGSMDDLNAASLDDVREWFRSYYGAANATLVISGDIDPETARAKAEKYFGSIPSGPPVARLSSWPAKRTGTIRKVAQDRVPQSRIHRVWNTPEYTSPERVTLDLVTSILGDGKSSRLQKRLIHDEHLASDVMVFASGAEIGGQFFIVVTARPGKDLGEIEKAIAAEVSRLIADGPTADELARAKVGALAGFVRRSEQVGGFDGKAQILAQGQAYAGDPGYYRRELAQIDSTTSADIRRVAGKWLTDGDFILEVYPFPEYETTVETVERSTPPVPKIDPELQFPQIERATLSNGLKVVLAARHRVPLVAMQLLVQGGFATDEPGKTGRASLTASLLDEGTSERDTMKIANDLARNGAELSVNADFDFTLVSLSALKAKLDPSLEIFADVALHPAFADEAFERMKKKALDAIREEESEPAGVAERVLPRLIYGAGHRFAAPFSGSGWESDVESLTPVDVKAQYAKWFRPGNATLIVTGDTTMDEIKPRLEKLFGGWRAGEAPVVAVSTAPLATGGGIFLVDRPGSIQSHIAGAQIVPARGGSDDFPLRLLNVVFGGTFTSRLNMNLREDKHWSYGAKSRIRDFVGERPLVFAAPVQTDKTSESLREMMAEFQGAAGGKPVQAAELDKARQAETLTLPGTWETLNRVAGSVSEIVRHGLPDDYVTTFPIMISAVQLEDIARASKLLDPKRVVWLVVGDREKIEPGLRALGKVVVVNSDGEPVE